MVKAHTRNCVAPITDAAELFAYSSANMASPVTARSFAKIIEQRGDRMSARNLCAAEDGAEQQTEGGPYD